jgi:hypothetical protein
MGFPFSATCSVHDRGYLSVVMGKHPLVVITHGSSRKMEEHAQVTPWQELPQALWFALRGWIALVVEAMVHPGRPDTRHGGRCPRTDYRIGKRESTPLRTFAWPLIRRADCRKWTTRALSPWAFPLEDSRVWR